MRHWFITLVTITSISPWAMANDPWRNPNQQAYQAFQAQQYEQAQSTFTDDRWKAASAFKAGDYQQAAQLFEAYDDVDAHYNRGNALAHQGDFAAALEAYNKALAHNPDHPESKQNRALVEQWLQQAQANQNQNSDNSTNPEEQNQTNDQKSGEQQFSEQQSSEQQTGQNQQSQSDQSNQPQDNKAAEQQSVTEAETNAEAETKADAFQQALEASEPNSEENDLNLTAETEENPATENTDSTAAHATDPTQSVQPLDPETIDLQRWLRYVDDAPGELLKRKFEYQAKQNQAQGGQHDEEYW